VTVRESIEVLYQQFARYPSPANIWVCDQCGPEWTEESIRATPLRVVSLRQLTAVHVMALDDDSLRHFFPRLMELMLHTHAPVFDFRLADVALRLPRWQPDEQRAVRTLARAVWSDLLNCYPCELGYFSDCASALDLVEWCGLDLRMQLDLLTTTETVSAARHLADLVEAIFTMRHPLESASTTAVLDWLTAPEIGARLQVAFFDADSDQAATQISNAHELWTVCASRS
jgi:hypothetical protein